LKSVVIVGGGTAGWLSAAVLAARFEGADSSGSEQGNGVMISVVESPEVATVGVGEGTWPSMRNTLKSIGVSESEFIRFCNVSLKQGTRFNGWSQGGDEYYYHPFSLPAGFGEINLAEHWQADHRDLSFCDAVSPQGKVCDAGLSAKNIAVPEYAFNLNYGYHLDAGKFAEFLKQHCCAALGVVHISDHVTGVVNDEDGYIDYLETKKNEKISADIFVDCTGFSARLIGQHLSEPLLDLSNTLFNDRALAVQIPYSLNGAQSIASTTHSTAQDNGWVWDIGLKSRRGVGLVYSSLHSTDDEAGETLKRYLRATAQDIDASDLEPRILKFQPGYRRRVWRKNCVAIGLSAGFVEPLEASALVLVETVAKALADHLPRDRDDMKVRASQVNQKLEYHWQQIVDFLKLHYVLSERTGTYWDAHRRTDSIPESLQRSMLSWRCRAPWHLDAPRVDELFSSASFQYVLYGMGWQTIPNSVQRRDSQVQLGLANQHFNQVMSQTNHYLKALPLNRQLCAKIDKFGFQKI